MHMRMGQQLCGDYVSGNNVAPLDEKCHPSHVGDRRVRMFILMHDQPVECQRSVEQLEMGVIQRGVIADHPRVHLFEYAGPHYRIEIEGSYVNADHQYPQHGKSPAANSPAAYPPAASRRSLFRFVLDSSTRGIECRSHLDVLFVLSEKQDRYRRIEARYRAPRQALSGVSFRKNSAARKTA